MLVRNKRAFRMSYFKYYEENTTLQIITKDGILVILDKTSAPIELDVCEGILINNFHGVKMFRRDDMKLLSEFEHHIFHAQVLGTNCCLKTLDQSDPQSFMREASILSKLSHPSIVRLIGLVESPTSAPVENEAQYVDGMLLEYVPGPQGAGAPLSLIDAPKEKFTAENMDKWISQLTSAVAHIHEEGFVWGDVKPDKGLRR
ncbi:Lipopolysaccharide kinase (Kdo/WaaP) [Rhizina undulata]